MKRLPEGVLIVLAPDALEIAEVVVDLFDLYRFRLNLNLEAAIENQQASNKAKSIEFDPIDFC